MNRIRPLCGLRPSRGLLSHLASHHDFHLSGRLCPLPLAHSTLAKLAFSRAHKHANLIPARKLWHLPRIVPLSYPRAGSLVFFGSQLRCLLLSEGSSDEPLQHIHPSTLTLTTSPCFISSWRSSMSKICLSIYWFPFKRS